MGRLRGPNGGWLRGPGGGKIRKNTSTPPSPESRTLLQPSDFTYLGSYRVPRNTPVVGGDTYFANGLTLKYHEGVPHLCTLAFDSSTSGTTDVNMTITEWADIAPTIVEAPDDPFTLSNYPACTLLLDYGNTPYIGSDATGRRLAYNGSTLSFVNGVLDGMFGIHWDEIDQRMYWTYGRGYSGSTGLESQSPCFGYSTLDYDTATGVGYGPWKVAGQSWKALMGGMVAIPSWFADAYLDGKRLGIGFGGYYSLVSSADCSLGPSLTAINPITDEADQSAVAATPLVGYWPYNPTPGVGKGRMDYTPLGITRRVPSPTYNDDDYTPEFANWDDRISGACWIDTGTKHGVMFYGNTSWGYQGYINAVLASLAYKQTGIIYDPADLADVALGTADRYSIQPTSVWDIAHPFMDTSKVWNYLPPTVEIASITTTAGVSKGEAHANGALVTTVGDHNFANTGLVGIWGAGNDFDSVWAAYELTSSNSFRIRNMSAPGNWTGSETASAGFCSLRPSVAGLQKPTPVGMAFDPNTNKLYIAIIPGHISGGTNMLISVYQVS